MGIIKFDDLFQILKNPLMVMMILSIIVLSIDTGLVLTHENIILFIMMVLSTLFFATTGIRLFYRLSK